MDAGCPFCCPKSRSDCEAETLGKFIYYTWNPPLLSLWTKLLVPINNHSVITRNPTNSASQNQDENQEEGQAENANAENSEPVATCVWIIPQNALLDPRCFVIFPFFYGVPFCKVRQQKQLAAFFPTTSPVQILSLSTWILYKHRRLRNMTSPHLIWDM